MLEERSAGVVLFNRAEGLQFLVLKYPSGHWDFVKGNIEQGEGEEETVKRELLEETGINNITLHKGFNEKAEYHYYRKNKIVHKIVSYYLAETEQKDVKISFEHLDYRWEDHDNVLKLITFDNSKDILRKGSQLIKNSAKN